MKHYEENFATWEDVQREYAMSEPEPDAVILARYAYEDYEGNSRVAYRRGKKYYFVVGGHCSCFGLEGQWEPTEYANKTEFVENMKKLHETEILARM